MLCAGAAELNSTVIRINFLLILLICINNIIFIISTIIKEFFLPSHFDKDF